MDGSGSPLAGHQLPIDPLTHFHPAVTRWFETVGQPTEAQLAGWSSIIRGHHTLVAAPTGSGKTLAAFLSAIDSLVQESQLHPLPTETRVLYISPLKALGNDIAKNLQSPIEGIDELLPQPTGIRTAVRTGDTTPSQRVSMLKKPPHIFVTTPESLFILLTSEGGRKMLSTIRTVIIDEIHAMVADRRGSHLSVTIERLERLVGQTTPGRKLQRVGLSATQKPVSEVAKYLVGASNDVSQCRIVDVGHQRKLDVALQLPESPLEAVMSHEVWEEVYNQIAHLVSVHRTTLVFVNTRRMAERLAKHLGDRLGEEQVTSHHGSLAKEHRLQAEQKLKTGDIKVLVATASLELGIDVGAVDLVCQVGSTRSISQFLQRVGRSGHTIGAIPKGRLFPLTRDELIESVGLLGAIRSGELDRIWVMPHPYDILGQQIVASVACEDWDEDELFQMMTQAYPYQELSREKFDGVLSNLSDGYGTNRGRRGAYLHRDLVHKKLRARRGARLAAVTSGGAIPELADYEVVLEPSGARVGTLNEDFAIESNAGDIFQLGNTSWRVLRVEAGKVRVEDAKGQPPNIPFWLGEAPGRTDELSAMVSRFREDFDDHWAVETDGKDGYIDIDAQRESVIAWMQDEWHCPLSAAEQLADYLGATKVALGAIPSQKTIVLERFFDEAGGMQLVVHSPFGSRINRAWGLSLRKRFCRSFNFELQAAANEDAIVISLGPVHSFPLDDVFSFLHADTVRKVLIQALFDAPMFGVRWRWNTTRSLAVLRFRGGKKVPPPIQRMQAEDLLATVFPDQLACLENIAGDREIPDDPLVEQTISDCLHEVMDVEGLEKLLVSIAANERTLLVRDLPEPSPLSQEILNANPYAFLDDAPLEERRTQAVMSRRWLDPKQASDLADLDPQAITLVREQAWPGARDREELHDALLQLGYLRDEEVGVQGWHGMMLELCEHQRVTRLVLGDFERSDPECDPECDPDCNPDATIFWVAAERLPKMRAVHPGAMCHPDVGVPDEIDLTVERDTAMVDIVSGRLDCSGPMTVAQMASSLMVPAADIEAAAFALEGHGTILRGMFTPGLDQTEWCERGLLARIHRMTIKRLRQEIEPVNRGDLMRFLLHWQRVDSHSQVEGEDSLTTVLEQLEGFDAAACAWEDDVLPTRLKDYRPRWLDAMCLAGRTTWLRLGQPATPNGTNSRSGGPVRSTPIALVARENLDLWNEVAYHDAQPAKEVSSRATKIQEFLAQRGASFFTELVSGAGMLKSEAEDALGELVATGRVSSDGFAGLRALIKPADRRPSRRSSRSRSGRGGIRVPASSSMDLAGRWSVVRSSLIHSNPDTAEGKDAAEKQKKRATKRVREQWDPETVQAVAWTLLRRYGVVFRVILQRERICIPWRILLRCYRSLEARGDVRGGRFIDGFSGEQFALPEAVGSLRQIRREKPSDRWAVVSGCDPLNLLGIVMTGERLPALPTNRIVFRDGEVVCVRDSGEVKWICETLTLEEKNKAERMLTRAHNPLRLATDG